MRTFLWSWTKFIVGASVDKDYSPDWSDEALNLATIIIPLTKRK